MLWDRLNGSNPYRGFAVAFPGCTDYKAIPWANFQNFGRILLFFLNCYRSNVIQLEPTFRNTSG
jgi:hypothetical protein